MQGIAEAKAKQRTQRCDRVYTRSLDPTPSRWNRTGGWPSAVDGASDVATKLQMRSPRGVGRRGQRHDQPQQRRHQNTWGGTP